MRIPLAQDLHINAFSSGSITDMESGVTNGIVIKSASGPYLTQRPSIDVFEDASLTVTDQKGRAIYYWAYNSALYFVNNNTIYKGTYGTVIGTITAGTQKCYFLELGTLLILLDPQNDQGWTISTGGTLTQITDVDFPPKQTPAIGLAFGGAILDSYLFVLGETGIIYNSDLSTAGSFNALAYLTAEREPDGGVYLAKHHDHLVVFGPRSMEFFYDASIASPASPLTRRQDVYYSMGCASGESVHVDGDTIYFVGSDASGSLGVYVLNNFAPAKISTPTLDAFLTKSVINDSYSLVGSGLSGDGRTLYILSVYLLSGTDQIQTSLCYDPASGMWSSWSTNVGGQSYFPLVSWTIRTGTTPRTGEGIFANGDLFTVIDNEIPRDTLGGKGWVESGWVATGWVVAAVAAGSNAYPITIKTRTGLYDGGTSKMKKITNMVPVIDKTANANTLTIRWANENNASFGSDRTIDTSVFERINASGSFRKRNFELEYAGTERLKIYALEGDIIAGIK
jgi:hypothetical protein